MNTTDKQPRRFKLLKDLPYVKAGAIYTINENENYRCANAQSFIKGIYQDTLSSQVVENTPEWFEEVKEAEKITVDEFEWYDSKTYQFRLSDKISKSKYPTIKQAIEYVLNDNIFAEDDYRVVVVKSYWEQLHKDFKILEEKLSKALNEDTVVVDGSSFQKRYFTKDGERLCLWSSYEILFNQFNALRSKESYWTDEMVLLLCDFCHHNGWHHFEKSVKDEFDEFKSIPCHKRMIPDWIKKHVNSPTPLPEKTDTEVEDEFETRMRNKYGEEGATMYKSVLANLERSTVKQYTQQEVDAIREETWKAARHRFQITSCGITGEPEFRYPELSDYLQSLPENPTKTTPTITKEQEQKEFLMENDKWEIMSLSTGGGYVTYLKSWILAFLHKELPSHSIHSVKRKSDGVVFTVGDKIHDLWEGGNSHFSGTVTGFELNLNCMLIKYGEGDKTMHIANAKKYPQPTQKITTNNDDVPCLSLNDVMSIIRCIGDNTTGYNNRSYINSMLHEKVKEKLKQ